MGVRLREPRPGVATPSLALFIYNIYLFILTVLGLHWGTWGLVPDQTQAPTEWEHGVIAGPHREVPLCL